MTIHACRSTLLLTAASLLVVAGCGDFPKFEVATVVHEDGTCDRALVQPRKGYLPAEARPAGHAAPLSEQTDIAPEWSARWTSISGSPEPPAEPQPSAKLTDHQYFRAQGTFDSPSHIPPHYRYSDPDQPSGAASELTRRFERTDFGLLVEYQWTETLTNTVTLATFVAARDRLLDDLLPRFAAQVARTLKAYDTTALEEYIKTGCRPMLVELSLAYFELADKKLSADELQSRLVAIAARHGFTLPSDMDLGELLDDLNILTHFERQILSKYLKHRDGTSVTEQDISQILALDTKFDEPEIDESLMQDAAAAIFGVYPFFRFFDEPEHFEFSLELPGRLAETNGLIEGPSRCLWRFSAGDTYPSGYRMTARSVVINPDGQRKLMGHIPVSTVPQAVRYIDLVGRDGPLLEAVRQAFATGSLDGLSELRSSNVADGRRLRELRRLFGVR
jgi:hypothetical protein